MFYLIPLQPRYFFILYHGSSQFYLVFILVLQLNILRWDGVEKVKTSKLHTFTMRTLLLLLLRLLHIHFL